MSSDGRDRALTRRTTSDGASVIDWGAPHRNLDVIGVVRVPGATSPDGSAPTPHARIAAALGSFMPVLQRERHGSQMRQACAGSPFVEELSSVDWTVSTTEDGNCCPVSRRAAAPPSTLKNRARGAALRRGFGRRLAPTSSSCRPAPEYTDHAEYATVCSRTDRTAGPSVCGTGVQRGFVPAHSR